MIGCTAFSPSASEPQWHASTPTSLAFEPSGAVSYTAVRREHNKLADQLVNEALDAAK